MNHLARTVDEAMMDSNRDISHGCDTRCLMCDEKATIALPGDSDIWLCDNHAAETAQSIKRLIKPLI